MLVVVFFNETATTESYTYGHTLSLHDALPILDVHGKRVLQLCCNNGRELLSVLRMGAAKGVGVDLAAGNLAQGRRMAAVAGRQHRSEEHTSELQSLMRISYAVFCLKKKNYPEQSVSNRTTPSIHINQPP